MISCAGGATTAPSRSDRPLADDSTSPPYESIDPRDWYPAVRQAVPLSQACREFLTAAEFSDDLLVGDPRMPEGDRRVRECIANLAVAAAAELAADLTPMAMGRAVAHEVARLSSAGYHPAFNWPPPEAE